MNINENAISEVIFESVHSLLLYRQKMQETARKGHVDCCWARLASDKHAALETLAELLDWNRRFEIVDDLTAIIKSARRHFRAIDGPEIVLHYIANLDRKDGTTPRQRKIYNLTEANRQRLLEKAEAIAAGLKGWRFIKV